MLPRDPTRLRRETSEREPQPALGLGREAAGAARTGAWRHLAGEGARRERARIRPHEYILGPSPPPPRALKPRAPQERMNSQRTVHSKLPLALRPGRTSRRE